MMNNDFVVQNGNVKTTPLHDTATQNGGKINGCAMAPNS
jgi:hypothetical protein